MCWKAESKYKEVGITLSTSIQSRDFLQQTKSESKSRDCTIGELSKRLTRMTHLVSESSFVYQKKVAYESSARDRLRTVII